MAVHLWFYAVIRLTDGGHFYQVLAWLYAEGVHTYVEIAGRKIAALCLLEEDAVLTLIFFWMQVIPFVCQPVWSSVFLLKGESKEHPWLKTSQCSGCINV